MNKHDADCLRRRAEMASSYLCTCGLTDAEVRAAKPAGYKCLTCGVLSVDPGGNCPHDAFQPLWPVGVPCGRRP